MQNAFDFCKNNNISITWTFIHIGLNFLDYKYRIKVSEIKEYASSQILSGNAQNALVSLLWVDDNSQEEALTIINELKKGECADIDLEMRKWVLYVMSVAIIQITKDVTTETLFEFNDLYWYLGSPKHFPQDMRNEDYLHCTDLNEAVSKNKEWLENELSELKQLEQ